MSNTDLAPRSGAFSQQPLAPMPGSALSRSAERQVSRGLDALSSEAVLAGARQEAQAVLTMRQAQFSHELAVLQEEAQAQLTALHEHGRGVTASTCIQELGATGAAADAVAKAFPMIAPQVFKIVDAQATGHAIAVMRY